MSQIVASVNSSLCSKVGHKQRGFTLIELIVTLVIMGIMSVIAVPRFFDFATDAKVASLKGVEASLTTAVRNIQAKANIEGQTRVTAGGGSGTSFNFDGLTLTIYNQGVPREIWANGFEQLLVGDFNFVGRGPTQLDTECTSSEFCVVDNLRMNTIISGKSGYGIFFFPKGYTLNDMCFTYYAFALGAGGFLDYKEVETVTTGCYS
ncbi:MAG: prepilin-type N-terminal cleavage/methylation domain-containing protein [Glaciecola sp.]